MSVTGKGQRMVIKRNHQLDVQHQQVYAAAGFVIHRASSSNKSEASMYQCQKRRRSLLRLGCGIGATSRNSRPTASVKVPSLLQCSKPAKYYDADNYESNSPVRGSE